MVMSHEATHVATDAATTSMPLWLVEGFADYVALRDVDLPLSVSAAQVAAQVRLHGAPAELPADAEFDTGGTHLGASYEAAWLACRTLAELGSEDELVAFYDAVEVRRRRTRRDAADLRVHPSGPSPKVWRSRLQHLVGVNGPDRSAAPAGAC